MSAIIFDGRDFARNKEIQLQTLVSQLRFPLRIGSLVFVEDEASLKYTNLKKQAAVRVGIEFSVEELSLQTPVPLLQDKIRDFSSRADFTGVMIQKPSKSSWQNTRDKDGQRFDAWWEMLTFALDPAKDVDCLTGRNLEKVYKAAWHILPATVKAIISVLHHAQTQYQLFGPRTKFELSGINTVVIGRSDIVGAPVSAVLSQYGAQVKNYGNDLDRQHLLQADLVISATGSPDLISAEMIKPGAVVIDVGSPGPDVQSGVAATAAFFTPVPYGIGPVTVVSLMENVYEVTVNGI